MADRKWEKHIIQQPKPGFAPNFFGKPADYVEATSLAFLDDEVIKGGFYTETVWFTKGYEEIAVHPHYHDYDEVLGFYGSDPDNPDDLGGEVEEWIEDERYVMTRSFIMFIPRGVKHGPLIIRRVDRPIFHFATGNGKLYGGYKV